MRTWTGGIARNGRGWAGGAALAAAFAMTVPAASAVPLGGDLFTHDPSRITQCDGKYYLYCTGPNCPMRVSKDMIHWTLGPGILNGVPAWAHQRVPKAKKDETWIWAPDVIKVGSLYYLYYSFSTFGSKTSVIGLVTSPTLDPASPKYHWTDRGLVVATNDSSNFNAIDPAPEFDAQGNLWLAFGSWNRGGIQLVKLDKATGKPASKQYFVAGGQSTGPEAAYLWYRKPYYYLFENEGLCCQGLRSTYKIMVGRSKSVTGPYLDKDGRDLSKGGGTVFLAARGNEIGPGHAGIITRGGASYLTFHYYDGKDNGRPSLGMEKLVMTKDGWPDVGYKPPHFSYDLPDGTYAIVSKATGLALTVHGNSDTDGASLDQSPYTRDKHQQWKVARTNDGFYRITSVANGKVVDLWYCKPEDGTKIDQFKWLDNACQRWKIEKQPGGTFRVLSQGGGGAMTVPSGHAGPGTEIQEFTYKRSANQQWIFKRP